MSLPKEIDPILAQKLLEEGMANSYNSFMITDNQLDNPGPKILYVNPAFTQMTGYSAKQIVGETPRILHGQQTERYVLDRLRRNLEKGEKFAGSTINYRKNGTPFYIEWQAWPVYNDQNQIAYFAAVQRDITQLKEMEHSLIEKAQADELTGAVNHTYGKKYLEEACQRAVRYNEDLAILFVDVDHFKTLHEKYGDDVGDKIIIDACKLIERSIRQTDILVRWGGTELMVISPHTDTPRAYTFATRLRHLMANNSMGGVRTTASIGLAQYKQENNIVKFLNRAEKALYSAQEKGGDRIEIQN